MIKRPFFAIHEDVLWPYFHKNNEAVERMWRLLGLLIIVGFIFLYRVPYVVQQQPHNERALYQQAQRALQNNQWQQFNGLLNQLQTYPLYPELYYQALQKQLTQLPLPQLNAYFSQYGATIRAKDLRHALLTELAKQQRWHDYVAYYKESDASLAEQCQYLLAMQQVGEVAPIQQYRARLWLLPKSAPNSCSLVYDVWLAQHLISQEAIWQRFELAIVANDLNLSQHLVNLLAPPYHALAQQWLALHKQPTLLPKMLDTIQHDPVYQAMITDGFIRYAAVKPQAAMTLFENKQQPLALNLRQTTDIARAISDGLVKKQPSLLKAWLRHLDEKYYDEKMAFWRIRYELLDQNWQQISHVINALPSPYKELPIWRYWYARALAMQGDVAQATTLYRVLAQEKNYYGLLAAQQLNETPAWNLREPLMNTTDSHRVANHPEILKVKEYYALSDYQRGNQLWWALMGQFDEQQRYIAARLAKQWGWHELSLMTIVKLPTMEDVYLKFPKLYSAHVEALSQHYQLEPAMIYAIIRQESLFMPQAKSFAGAMGLMQLMPYTAKAIIQQAKLPDNYRHHLYDPRINIDLGCYYVALLQKQYDKPILTIAAYNAGPQRVKQWLPKKALPMDIWVELIPWHETRNYVKKVVAYTAIYQLMSSQPFDLHQYLQRVSR